MPARRACQKVLLPEQVQTAGIGINHSAETGQRHLIVQA